MATITLGTQNAPVYDMLQTGSNEFKCQIPISSIIGQAGEGEAGIATAVMTLKGATETTKAGARRVMIKVTLPLSYLSYIQYFSTFGLSSATVRSDLAKLANQTISAHIVLSVPSFMARQLEATGGSYVAQSSDQIQVVNSICLDYARAAVSILIAALHDGIPADFAVPDQASLLDSPLTRGLVSTSVLTNPTINVVANPSLSLDSAAFGSPLNDVTPRVTEFATVS